VRYPRRVLLTTVVVAIALGVAAQIVADRFQLPAILPLLLLGILCGPAGLAWFRPESLGHGLEVLVHLGVAVILFEGGLSLDPRRLAEVGPVVRNLVTVGALAGGAVTAWLGHAVAGLEWPVAVLLGAILTVTGPTVVVPLLHHMVAPRQLKTILVSEGLLIDPVGAVAAYLVLQWVENAGVPRGQLLGQLARLAATGAVVGFAAGAAARFVLRRRWIAGELRNLSVLALLMVAFAASEAQAPQSGILAAVVMGLTVSASEVPDLVSLKAFKGQLTTLLISVLFVLLAGQLDLGEVAALGWRGPAVAAGLILLARPVTAAVSAWGGGIGWRERVALALTAPRGIVAAAVASLSARQLAGAGIPGSGALEGLVYLTILATGGWATAMAVVLPRVLGYTSDPARRRIVLVGANALAEALTRALAGVGRTLVVVDGTSWRLDPFREAGLTVVCGDAREAITFEEAGVERDSTVVALTTNDELNLIVAEEVRAEFGVDHPVVALQRPPEDLGRRSRAWLDLLGGRAVPVPAWIRRLDRGEARVVTVRVGNPDVAAALREVLREEPEGIVPLFRIVEGDVRFDVRELEGEVALLVAAGRPAELVEPLAAGKGEGGDAAGG